MRVLMHGAVAMFGSALWLKPAEAGATEIIESLLVLVGMSGISLAGAVAASPAGPVWKSRWEIALLGTAWTVWASGAVLAWSGDGNAAAWRPDAAACAAIAGGAWGLDRHMRRLDDWRNTSASRS